MNTFYEISYLYRPMAAGVISLESLMTCTICSFSRLRLMPIRKLRRYPNWTIKSISSVRLSKNAPERDSSSSSCIFYFRLTRASSKLTGNGSLSYSAEYSNACLFSVERATPIIIRRVLSESDPGGALGSPLDMKDLYTDQAFSFS